MSWLIQSPAACFHTREMDLHPRQVEAGAEITASNNNSLPRSLCQEQLAERTRGVTYHQHREPLKLWKRWGCCLPAADKQQDTTESQAGIAGFTWRRRRQAHISSCSTLRLPGSYFKWPETQQTNAEGFFLQLPSPHWQNPEDKFGPEVSIVHEDKRVLELVKLLFSDEKLYFQTWGSHQMLRYQWREFCSEELMFEISTCFSQVLLCKMVTAHPYQFSCSWSWWFFCLREKKKK